MEAIRVEETTILVTDDEPVAINLEATGPMTPAEALELAEKLRLVAVIARGLEAPRSPHSRGGCGSFVA